MKKTRILFAFSFAAAFNAPLLATVTSAGSSKEAPCPNNGISSPRIGYVDAYKAIPNLDSWKDEGQKIQKELETKRAQIEELKMTLAKKANELQTQGNILNDATKQAKREELMSLENSIQIKQQSFQEYAERIMQEAQMKIFKEIELATRELAQEQKLDFVLAGGTLYVNEKYDITQDVVARMNAKYIATKKAAALQKTPVAPASSCHI